MIDARILEATDALGIALTPAQARRMAEYWEAVAAAPLNLTAIKDGETAALLHFADALTPLKFGLLPRGARVLDVGTGGGFPAVPLAIARADLHVVAIDGTQKKLDFIRRYADLPNLTLIHARAEELAHDPAHAAAYDVALARAVAGLDKLAGYLLPFVRKGGAMLAYKADPAPDELEAGARACKRLSAAPFVRYRLALPTDPPAARSLFVSKKL